MTDDLIAQTEAALAEDTEHCGWRPFVVDLLAALKAERAARHNADTLSEDVITHVLADIDQVINEEQWSLRERLEVVQKICDGSEYCHD